MGNENGLAHVVIAEGYKPTVKNWKSTVQGGYKPAATNVHSSPPKGGSGVKAPTPPKP